jgi:hypothetical protein
MGSAGWLTLYIEAKVYAAQKAEVSARSSLEKQFP